MAIITENEKAKIQLSDLHGRTLCTYTGVDPDIQPLMVKTFADGINELRNDTISYSYLITECELEESEEE